MTHRSMISPGAETMRVATERAEENEDGTMRFVASTDSVDRYDSRVMQHWRLENFNRNPVFLWMHDRRGTPVGKVTSFDVEDSRSLATVQFAPTSAGDELRTLYAEGFLNAVSVGFRAGQVTYIDDDDVVKLGSAENPNELFELSGVTLPGNAEALAEGRADGLTEAIDRQLLALFQPMVNRKLDEKDLDLLRVGVAPRDLDMARNMNELRDQIALLTERGVDVRVKSTTTPAEDDLRVVKAQLNESHESEPQGDDTKEERHQGEVPVLIYLNDEREEDYGC